MSGKWSGLAPAVDAHLALWRLAEHSKALSDTILDGNTSTTTLNQAIYDEHLGRWITFGMSYGLPDADGKPIIAQQALSDFGFVDTYDEIDKVLAETLVVDGATISGREQFTAGAQAVFQGALLAHRERKMLREAVTHYVSAEVIDEVTTAAELAEPEPLFHTDLFTPCGFAVLEKPVIVPDLDSETGLPSDKVNVWVRAFGWQHHGGIASTRTHEVGEGVSIFFYTTGQDYMDGYVTDMRAIGREVAEDSESQAWLDQMLQMEVIPWMFGSEWTTRAEVGHRPGTVPGPVGFQRRWFLAFMRLCWQEIIVRHATHEPRHNHRRWERFAKRKPVLDYTVLRLRRVVDPNYKPSGMGLPLDKRILVRGHWKRVHLKAMGPARLPDGRMDPNTHRLKWIEPYWKGPEDGPLGPMHSATSVVR